MNASPPRADSSFDRRLLASALTLAALSLSGCGPATESPRARLNAGWLVNALALSPDRQLLAVGIAGRHAPSVDIGLWDVKKQEQVGSLKGGSASVGALVFSPDGEALYSGRLDGTIERWTVRTRKLERVIEDIDTITALAIRPDGATLLSMGGKSRVRMFDLRVHKQVDSLGEKRASSMALGSDGKVLAIGQRPLQVELIDLDTRRTIRSLVPQGESWTSVDQVALQREGKLLVTATDGRLEWWDVSAGRSLGAMDAHASFLGLHPDYLLSIVFSPNGAWLATSGSDGTIQVWNTQTRQRARLLAEKSQFDVLINPDLRTDPCCLVFGDDDGNVIFSGHHDHMVRVWAAGGKGVAEHRR